MKFTFIIGTQSGGTSATSGILAVNGYETFSRAPFFEAKAVRALYKKYANTKQYGLNWTFYPPTAPIPAEEMRDCLAGMVENYYGDATRAAIKVPGAMMWHPHLIDILNINPILVLRDSHEHSRSTARRSRDPAMAMQARRQIVTLAAQTGWPVWNFSKDAKIAELEDILGHKLPVPYFDPQRIRS